jgi:hypothetical protein
MAKKEWPTEPAKPLEWTDNPHGDIRANSTGDGASGYWLWPNNRPAHTRVRDVSVSYHPPGGGELHWLANNGTRSQQEFGHKFSTIDAAKKAAAHHHVATHYGFEPHEVDAIDSAWPDEGPARFIGVHPDMVRAELARLNKSESLEKMAIADLQPGKYVGKGQNPERVEREYRRAIELNPTYVWWRSRLVRFLITRGRIDDARRAWDEAQDAWVGSDRRPDFAYEHLHLSVAALLVRRAQLEFAQEVVALIPSALLSKPKFRAVKRRLEALRDARDGGGVFPLWVAPESWWTTPQLLPPKSRSGKKLQRWLPARIEEVDSSKKVVHLRTAERKGPKTRYYTLDVPFARFDEWSQDERASDLTAGRFLELGFYAEGKRPDAVIRTHKVGEWLDADFMKLKE